MILTPIALIVVVLGPINYLVYVFVVLNGIITRLNYSIFYIQLAMNILPPCMTTYISSLKLYVCIVIDLLV